MKGCLSLKITNHGVIARLEHCLEGWDVSIGSRNDKSSITNVIPQIMITVGKETLDNFHAA